MGRATLFKNPGDDAAFETVLRQGWEEFGIGAMSFLVLPNHRRLVLRPHESDALISYMQWITVREESAPSIRGGSIIPHTRRRSLSDGVPLRGAQRFAGDRGAAGAGLALVALVASGA